MTEAAHGARWTPQESTLILLGDALHAGALAAVAARAVRPPRVHPSPMATNPSTLLRGALGDLAVEKWARAWGWEVSTCFAYGRGGRPEITIEGLGFDIATARVDHRRIDGFCASPSPDAKRTTA